MNRRRSALEPRAAIPVVLSLIAFVIGLYLSWLFGQCGTDEDDSYGWLKLTVGACFLAPGIVAAVLSRTAERRQTMLLMTFLGAFPLVIAWGLWIERYSGCSS